MNVWKIATVALALGFTVTACGSAADNANKTGGGNTSTSELNEARKVQPADFSGPTDAAKAPSGLKVGIVSCGQALEGCANAAAGVAEAAKAAGYDSRLFDTQAKPDLANGQIQTAVTWGADIVVLVAISPKIAQAGLTQADTAGATIVSIGNGDEPIPGQVWSKADVTPDFPAIGKTMGEWIVADSSKKAKVLVLDNSEYATVKKVNDALTSTLQDCSGCEVTAKESFTSAQLASALGPTVVSILRQHPDINYVAAPFDPAAAVLVPAIQAAGLASKVKVVSNGGNKVNLDYVKTGKVQAADVGIDWVYTGWAVLDQAIRLRNGAPLIDPVNENTPIGLIDQVNLPDAKIGDHGFQAPYDYQSKYTDLWK